MTRSKNLKRLSALVLLIGAVACTGKSDAPRGAGFNPGSAPAEVAVGESLFVANCSACHGNLALGSDKGPPLVHIIYEPGHHADESFRRAVAQGVVPHHWGFGPMPAISTLSSEQVEAIIRYVRWLQRKAGIT